MSPRFVVHEHHASRLHYDFRLERDGVLRSWAVPRGPSMNPSEKRLAVVVKDHPLEYAEFEGIIPADSYGAGAVIVWDTGTYESPNWEEEKISLTLDGQKLKGDFTLMRFRGRGKQGAVTGNEWLLVKKQDEYADPQWVTRPDMTPEREKELVERTPPCKAS